MQVSASGTLYETGVDEMVSITLRYPGNRMAVITVSTNTARPQSVATVYGTTGNYSSTAIHFIILLAITAMSLRVYRVICSGGLDKVDRSKFNILSSFVSVLVIFTREKLCISN